MPERTAVTPESRDVSPRAILAFGGGLMLFLAVALVVLRLIFGLAPSPQAFAAGTGLLQSGVPVLETTPRADRIAYDAGKQKLLASYGWVDRKAGIARMPIADAMRLLAMRGIPGWGTGVATTSDCGVVAENVPRAPQASRVSRERGAAMRLVGAALGILLSASAAWAGALIDAPAFHPTIGGEIDPGLSFRDETGRTAGLRAFTDGRPALLLLGYDRCPGLCGVAQLDLAEALDKSGLTPGAYRVIFASIDPAETPADAAAAREALREAANGIDLSAWRFLTGDRSAIAALEASLGLTVATIPGRNLYVHPVAVSALTPAGRLSRVFEGLDYAPRDLRLAIVEASAGRLGSLVDRIAILCSGFDPATGRYTSAVLAGLRAGGIATLLALAGLIAVLRRRERI